MSLGPTIAPDNIKISENVATVFSANCKTNLTGSQAWTGSFVPVTNQSCIQIISKFDKDTIIYVDQSQAGSAADITDSWSVISNQGFSIAIASVAPYYRVRITNSSSASATGQLTSAATAIFMPLPRTVDSKGYLQTGVQRIAGPMNHDVIVSPMGGLKTAKTYRLVGTSFVGNTFDTNFWLSTPTSGGSVSQENGAITLTTGTSANAGELVTSVRVARYVPALPNYYRGNIRCPAVTTASSGFVNTCRWGAFDTANGFFFKAVQTNPATVPTLSVVSRKTPNGGSVSDSAVDSGSFNGSYGTTYTLDTNVHTYEIFFTNKNAYFFIDDVLLHTLTGAATTLTSTLSLKVGLQVVNSGDNTAANTLVVRSSTINRLGEALTNPQYYHITGAGTATVLKYGPGTLHRVIVNNPANQSITIYDAVSAANAVAIINPGSSATPFCLDYELPLSTGLCITVAGTIDATVVYE